MPGPLHEFLAGDHRRLDGRLARILDRPAALDHGAYDEFRRGLLRHIAMEEKVLFPLLRRARGRSSPLESQLHRDHLALSVLLVRPPALDAIEAIRELLELHNPPRGDAG